MKNYKVEQQTKITPVSAILKIVSFAVSGNKEYGALLVPEVGINLPIPMYVGGFGIDQTINSIRLLRQKDRSQK